jgi:hypothetical protein
MERTTVQVRKLPCVWYCMPYPSIQKAEAGGSWVWSQPGVHSETIFVVLKQSLAIWKVKKPDHNLTRFSLDLNSLQKTLSCLPYSLPSQLVYIKELGYEVVWHCFMTEKQPFPAPLASVPINLRSLSVSLSPLPSSLQAELLSSEAFSPGII